MLPLNSDVDILTPHWDGIKRQGLCEIIKSTKGGLSVLKQTKQNQRPSLLFSPPPLPLCCHSFSLPLSFLFPLIWIQKRGQVSTK